MYHTIFPALIRRWFIFGTDMCYYKETDYCNVCTNFCSYTLQNVTDDVYDALLAEKIAMQTKTHELEARLSESSEENSRLKVNVLQK